MNHLDIALTDFFVTTILCHDNIISVDQSSVTDGRLVGSVRLPAGVGVAVYDRGDQIMVIEASLLPFVVKFDRRELVEYPGRPE